MEDKVLSALLDLQIALGEIQAAMTDLDQAIRKLVAVQFDALQSKNASTPLSPPEGQKEDSHE